MTKRPMNSRVQHGQPTCADYGCKRDECLKARRDKQKRNKLLRTTGRPGMSSPDRAAAHITKFRAAGLMDKEIIVLMSLSRNTFYRIMRGEPITRVTERSILNFPVPSRSGQVRTLATVAAFGSHRRLQALFWLGWPAEVLEERLKVHQGWIERSFRRTRITLLLESRIKSLYDELWRVRPETSGVFAGRAEETRRKAADQGWNGPLAWDDDTIDNPAAVPMVDADQPAATEGANIANRWLMGESVVLDSESRLQVLVHLFEWTSLPSSRIAERLGMTQAAAEQAWFRYVRKARAEGRPVPWRRVWDLRDKAFKQSEMGAAA